MSNLKIALIAEDNTDCEAIRTIVHRVLGAEVTTKKWASKGCSSLTKKLRAKLKLLSSEGCNIFIVVHDLDRNPQNGSLNNEQALRSKLEELSSERMFEKWYSVIFITLLPPFPLVKGGNNKNPVPSPLQGEG